MSFDHPVAFESLSATMSDKNWPIVTCKPLFWISMATMLHPESIDLVELSGDNCEDLRKVTWMGETKQKPIH